MRVLCISVALDNRLVRRHDTNIKCKIADLDSDWGFICLMSETDMRTRATSAQIASIERPDSVNSYTVISEH